MKRKLTMSKSPTIQEAFQQFQQFNRVKNLSDATIGFYEQYYANFVAFYGDDSQLISSLDQATVDDYTLDLRQRKELSGTSVNIHLRALRVFLYFCMERNYIDSFKIRQMKVNQPVKEPYTNEELTLILKKPNLKDCSFAQYRNWVLVNFLLGTGCRASTLVNVKIEDLHFTDGFIVFWHTKNRTQQIVPLSKSLTQILLEYLQYRGDAADEYLFITSRSSKMRVDSLVQAVAKHNRSRGVEKTSLHLFRHTYAKLYITAGGDPFRLQKLLGHSDLTMTKRYVALYADDLKQNYDRMNPLEQMSQSRPDKGKMRL